MANYELLCFAQSGNAYRAALMLNLIGADWKPVFVDFFKGQTRTPVGAGLIGLRVGQSISWPDRGGHERLLTIENVTRRG